MPKAAASLRSGFTLIELSIVLVIIALMLGAIIGGRELYRASQLQTVLKDVSTIQNAAGFFRQKYDAIPGDFNKASSYWGLNANCATGGTGTGTETCDGNNNGQVSGNSAYPYEQFYIWQHLANAGMLSGSYTGAPIASGNFAYCQPGSNCPIAKIAQNVTFFIYYISAQTNTANPWWVRDALTGMFIGAANATPGISYPAYAFILAQEAAALDAKVDDGKPGLGKWTSSTAFTLYINKCVVDAAGAALTDSSAASAQTAVYNVTYTAANACSLLVSMW